VLAHFDRGATSSAQIDGISRNCGMFKPLHPLRLLTLIAVFWISSATESEAQSVSLEGNAISLGGGCYRLTAAQNSQKGAVWYPGTVDISVSWEMNAQVYLGTSNGGADGMTFALRDPDSPALGGGGSFMGYGGNFANPAIEPSVAVEMDTYQSGAGSPGAGDPTYDHLAIHRDGNLSHLSANALAGPTAAVPPFGNIENGVEHHLRVTYDATSLLMTVYFDCNERLSEVIDLEDILGATEVKWGFTASTGGLSNLHRVCDAEWTVMEDVVAPDAVACAGDPVELSISEAAVDPVWSPSLGLSSVFGNTVTATLSSSQTYTVTYEDVCEEEYTLTVDVDIVELPETGLPADTVACNLAFIELLNGPWPAGIIGTWNDGSNDAVYAVSGAGSYTLTLEDVESGCIASSDIDVVAVELPELTLGPDQMTCPGELVSFDFSGYDPNLNFTWNAAPGNALFATTQQGTVIAEWGLSVCTAADTVEIGHYPTYQVSWEENPIVLCLDEIEIASAQDPNWTGGTVEWLWNDGSTNDALVIGEAGTYSLDVTTDNCTYSYAIEAVDSPNQGVDLGADVLLCDTESVTFNSGYAGANTLWISGGDAAGSFTSSTTVANESTTVIAQVTVGTCIEGDTVDVYHVPFFDAGLPDALDLCLNDSVELSAALGAESYTWNNGPLTPQHWVDAPGTYEVEMALEGCIFADEVLVTPSSNAGVDLGLDAVACDGEVVILNSGYTAAETQWWENGLSVGNGAAWSVLNQDATVVAEVTVGVCVERDTVMIDYAPVFNTGLPSSLPLCNGDSIWLVANVGAPEYQWSTGETATGIWLTAPGVYTLTTPIQGCDYSTNVSVQNIPLPVFNLGPDQTICAGTSSLLSTGLFNADATSWSTGSTEPTLDVSNAGTYSVVVTENGCSAEDEVIVSVQALPEFDLGEDQELCPDEEAYLYIYPLPEAATVSWSTGSSASSITASSPGVYSALVNWNGCIWTDDVVIERAAPILIDIAEPLKFCEGESMVVSAANPPNLFPIAYEWSNGLQTPAITIDRPGLYAVTAQNTCDSITKEFEVNLEYCECPVYVPNAFTPDNDGANDLWLPVLGCEPTEYRLEVFNTWGELIFATEDASTGWFGQVEENPESSNHSGYFTRSNVYHWRISLVFPDEENPLTPARLTYEGHVHVVH